MGQSDRCEICNSQFFTHFPFQSHLYAFTQIDMSANGCIPFAGLDILPVGTLLQIEFATAVENMQVDNRMQQFASVVTFASCSGSRDIPFFVYDGEHFFVIISHDGFYAWFLQRYGLFGKVREEEKI